MVIVMQVLDYFDCSLLLFSSHLFDHSMILVQQKVSQSSTSLSARV